MNSEKLSMILIATIVTIFLMFYTEMRGASVQPIPQPIARGGK